jgi:hypothetical protein
MSLLFGPLRQMGYVVRDIEGAMRHWIDVCGIGPWFYADRLPLTAFTYRGARHDGIHLARSRSPGLPYPLASPPAAARPSRSRSPIRATCSSS